MLEFGGVGHFQNAFLISEIQIVVFRHLTQPTTASEMAQHKPRLTYFDGRGLGEFSRLIFAEAKVDFEDVRIKEDDIPKELIASGKLAFNQVPLLEYNGIVLVQSATIARFLAKQFGLAGKNETESAQADMIVEGLRDLKTAHRNAKTDADKTKFKTETLPKWCGFFENLLKKNDSNGFFVGSNITYADLLSFDLFTNPFLWGPDILSTHPHLKQQQEIIASRPNIAKYIKNRVETDF